MLLLQCANLPSSERMIPYLGIDNVDCWISKIVLSLLATASAGNCHSVQVPVAVGEPGEKPPSQMGSS